MTLKGSYKYYVVSLLNLIILTTLLVLWTDKLELIFNNVRLVEFLEIIACTIISLLVIRLSLFIFRRINITNVKIKICIAVVITLLIFSYLYIGYSIKIINNRFINRAIRNKTQAKVYVVSANEYKATNLTIQEYNEIIKLSKFIAIPKQSTNIDFSYHFDDFLPDYYLQLTYYLPIEIKADTIDYIDGEFSRSQTISIINGKQKVNYYEILQ